MKLVCDKCGKEGQTRNTDFDDATRIPPAKMRKYTYVLPSGRKLKVVVDDDTHPVMDATQIFSFQP